MTKEGKIVKRKLSVEAFDAGMLLVLQTGWIDGKNSVNGTEISLTCGAGVGNSLLILRVNRDGISRREAIDVTPLLQEWAEQIEKEINAELPEAETKEADNG